MHRPRPALADAAGEVVGLGDRPRGRVALEAHHGVVYKRSGVDGLPVGANRHRVRLLQTMAVGAGPRPFVAHAASGPGGLADRPGGRVTVEEHHSIAGAGADIDALSVLADRHPDRDTESVPVGAGPRTRLADAAGRPRWLADRPGGRGAVEARHCIVERGHVHALPVRADRHRVRAVERMAVGAGPRSVLADAAGGPGGLADRPRGRVAIEARHCSAAGNVDALSVGADSHRPHTTEGMAGGAAARTRLADAAGRPRGLADRPRGGVSIQAHQGASVPVAEIEVGRCDVDALAVRAHRHRGRCDKSVAVGAVPRTRLTDAAGRPRGLAEVTGHRERGRGHEKQQQAGQRERDRLPARNSPYEPARAAPLGAAVCHQLSSVRVRTHGQPTTGNAVSRGAAAKARVAHLAIWSTHGCRQIRPPVQRPPPKSRHRARDFRASRAYRPRGFLKSRPPGRGPVG